MITSVFDLAGHGVLLLAELGHPEGVDDVVRRDLELDVPVDRQAKDAVALAVRVGERATRTAARVTLITSGLVPAWPFLASTIALTIEIAVTSTNGIAVQTISSVV